MSTFDEWLDEVDQDVIETKSKRDRKTYPCGQCAGTGVWRGGYVNPTSGKCHACRGRGYFLTPPRQREAAKQKRNEKKLQAQEENAALPIFERVKQDASWNSFCASLIEQHNSCKSWSDKQIAAVTLMFSKTDEKRRVREERATTVQVSKIVELFDAARASGYKRPKIRAEGLAISLAPANGVNAGCLYVKTEDGDYLGKIKDNRWLGQESAAEALVRIAEDPREAAIAYGRRTGVCACCGRTLSNKQSIELGIGPICAEKWFND